MIDGLREPVVQLLGDPSKGHGQLNEIRMATMHATFNTVEAIVWFCLAVAIAWRSLRGDTRHRTCGMITAIAFAAFGVSDLVEIQTGAWYRPLWLAAWKAACIATFFACYCRFRQIRTTYSERTQK
jgi:hypothetical protein